MKKVKTVLCAAMACALFTPVAVSAEEVSYSDPGDKTVELTAEAVSSYTVKLPKSVDVSQTSTTFDVKVAGDIAGDEKITLTMTDGALKETNAGSQPSHADVNYTVTYGENKSQEYLWDDIDTEKVDQATIDHAKLPAGSWTGTLNVNIAFDTVTK